MTSRILGFFLCLTVAGCTDANPAYCLRDADCTDPRLPICDPIIHGCVSDQTELDGGNEAPKDGDRSADAADGGDADAAGLYTVYVSIETCPDVGDGTMANPYCSIATALGASGGAAETVVILPGTYSENLQVDHDVHIQGDDAVIQTSICPGIQVLAGASVILNNLEIRGSGGVQVVGESSLDLMDSRVEGTDCIGVECQGEASRCRLHRNWIISNSRGGVLLNRVEFTLENNVIARNGTSVQGIFGGVSIIPSDTSSLFRNNTVVYNESWVTGGVSCSVSVDPVRLENSILWGNSNGDVMNCQVYYSNVSQQPGTYEGSENISLEPGFANAASGDYHLSTGSSCTDRLDAAGAPSVDIDGQARPYPAGGLSDMGADEVH